MNSKKVTSLYGSLNREQQATLVFKFLAQDKFAEADKVFDSVPVGLYECTDQKFIRRVQGLMEVSHHLSIAFWKNYAIHLAGLTLFWMRISKEDLEGAEEILDKAETITSKIAAVEQVFDDAEELFSVDTLSLRRLAHVPEERLILGDPDFNFMEQLRLDLIELLGEGKGYPVSR